MPPDAGADLRAAFVASCLRGALPAVDLRAVCLVRAIVRMSERRCDVAREGGERSVARTFSVNLPLSIISLWYYT